LKNIQDVGICLLAHAKKYKTETLKSSLQEIKAFTRNMQDESRRLREVIYSYKTKQLENRLPEPTALKPHPATQDVAQGHMVGF
jgi:hypothetical protein